MFFELKNTKKALINRGFTFRFLLNLSEFMGRLILIGSLELIPQDFIIFVTLLLIYLLLTPIITFLVFNKEKINVFKYEILNLIRILAIVFIKLLLGSPGLDEYSFRTFIEKYGKPRTKKEENDENEEDLEDDI